jgi:hypothetical protein
VVTYIKTKKLTSVVTIVKVQVHTFSSYFYSNVDPYLPGLTEVTPYPTLSTIPAPSWPRMLGNFRRGSDPFRRNASLWQTPVYIICNHKNTAVCLCLLFWVHVINLVTSPRSATNFYIHVLKETPIVSMSFLFTYVYNYFNIHVSESLISRIAHVFRCRHFTCVTVTP